MYNKETFAFVIWSYTTIWDALITKKRSKKYPSSQKRTLHYTYSFICENTYMHGRNISNKQTHKKDLLSNFMNTKSLQGWIWNEYKENDSDDDAQVFSSPLFYFTLFLSSCVFFFFVSSSLLYYFFIYLTDDDAYWVSRQHCTQS